MRLISILLLVLLMACSGTTRRGSSDPADDGSDVVEEKVVTEKQPDGSIKRTTIRTTRRKVEAPPLNLGNPGRVPEPSGGGARPADPMPGDPLIKHNVDKVNAYRSAKGLAPVVYDSKISAFATRGSEQLSRDHTPHAHFQQNAHGARLHGDSSFPNPPPGFGSKAAENQGDPGGVPVLDPDPSKNGRAQVDMMLKMMMDEGPGGGHYDNMMNPRFRRIGIGLVYAGGKLYMTNDFSD